MIDILATETLAHICSYLQPHEEWPLAATCTKLYAILKRQRTRRASDIGLWQTYIAPFTATRERMVWAVLMGAAPTHVTALELVRADKSALLQAYIDTFIPGTYTRLSRMHEWAADVSSNIETVARAAATQGDSEFLKWVHSKYEALDWEEIQIAAADGGFLVLAAWCDAHIRTKTWSSSYALLACAARAGDLCMVRAHMRPDIEPAHIGGKPHLKNAYAPAAKHGHVHVLEFLRKKGIEPHFYGFLWACVQSGKLEVLEWYHKHMHPHVDFESHVLDAYMTAHHAKRPDIMDWLEQHGYHWDEDQTPADELYTDDYIPSFQWRFAAGPFDFAHIDISAILDSENNDALARLLCEHGAPLDDDDLLHTARLGKLDLLKWMVARMPHANIDDSMRSIAAHHGHVHVVQWFVDERGSTMTRSDVSAAVLREHVNILDFFRRRDAGFFDEDAYFKAVRWNCTTVIRWLYAHSMHIETRWLTYAAGIEECREAYRCLAELGYPLDTKARNAALHDDVALIAEYDAYHSKTIT